MKFTSFLIPIAVVAIGGAWIANQFRKHSDLQNEIARLQRRIKVTTPASLSPPAIRNHRTALEKDPVDWQQVALELGRNKGGPGIFKTTRRIEEQLRALSADELKTALKVIDEGSLDPRAKLGLTYRLLRLLLEVDPGYLITHRSSNPEVAAAWEKWQNDAMINWTRKEPAKAVAWFDAQPADAFSPERKKEFQLGIFNSLFVVDFEKAKDRLSRHPQKERGAFVTNFSAFGASWTGTDVADQNLTARFAEIARLAEANPRRLLTYPLLALPEQDRPMGIGSIQNDLKGWHTMKRGKLPLDSFTDYLVKIDASSDEVDMCIDAILEGPYLDLTEQPEREPDELRAWLKVEVGKTLRSK